MLWFSSFYCVLASHQNEQQNKTNWKIRGLWCQILYWSKHNNGWNGEIPWGISKRNWLSIRFFKLDTRRRVNFMQKTPLTNNQNHSNIFANDEKIISFRRSLNVFTICFRNNAQKNSRIHSFNSNNFSFSRHWIYSKIIMQTQDATYQWKNGTDVSAKNISVSDIDSSITCSKENE